VLGTLFSFRGLILVIGLVAIALPLALVAQLGIVRTLYNNNAEIAQIRVGQFALAAVLQGQLDEESGLRGYAATGRAVFLEPYRLGHAALPKRLAELDSIAGPAGSNSADDQRSVAAMRHINAEWLQSSPNQSWPACPIRTAGCCAARR
jgi:CHASE3 domain sensor protein